MDSITMNCCPVYNSSKYDVYEFKCVTPLITSENKDTINHVTPFNKRQVDFNDFKTVCKLVSTEKCKPTNACALGKYN